MTAGPTLRRRSGSRAARAATEAWRSRARRAARPQRARGRASGPAAGTSRDSRTEISPTATTARARAAAIPRHRAHRFAGGAAATPAAGSPPVASARPAPGCQGWPLRPARGSGPSSRAKRQQVLEVASQAGEDPQRIGGDRGERVGSGLRTRTRARAASAAALSAQAGSTSSSPRRIPSRAAEFAPASWNRSSVHEVMAGAITRPVSLLPSASISAEQVQRGPARAAAERPSIPARHRPDRCARAHDVGARHQERDRLDRDGAQAEEEPGEQGPAPREPQAAREQLHPQHGRRAATRAGRARSRSRVCPKS